MVQFMLRASRLFAGLRMVLRSMLVGAHSQTRANQNIAWGMLRHRIPQSLSEADGELGVPTGATR
jgi:hypothetical protein